MIGIREDDTIVADMPDFSMTMEIDHNGVVVAVFKGEFDARQWMRQRREDFEKRYGPADYDGRPVVTDMRNCRLPQRDWARQFEEVAHFIKERRPKPFRNAIVVSDLAGMDTAISLFAEYQKIFHHPNVETRPFLGYDEAYAWALEGLDPQQAARTTKAPENGGLRETSERSAKGQRE